MAGVVKTYDEALLKARLRLRKNELALAVVEIAHRAGMAPGQVSSTLSKTVDRPIGLPVLVRLADALECSLDWLLGRDTFAAASGCGDAVPTAGTPTLPAAGDGETTAPTAFSGSQSRAVVVLSPDAA